MSSCFGRLIREHRVQAKLSLTDVANAIDVSAIELGAVERGEAMLPPRYWEALTKAIPTLTFAELSRGMAADISDHRLGELESAIDRIKDSPPWTWLPLYRDELRALLARLRKAEAERAAARAHVSVLRRALEEIRDEDEDRFKDGVPSLSLKSRARIDAALRVTKC